MIYSRIVSSVVVKDPTTPENQLKLDILELRKL